MTWTTFKAEVGSCPQNKWWITHIRGAIHLCGLSYMLHASVRRYTHWKMTQWLLAVAQVLATFSNVVIRINGFQYSLHDICVDESWRPQLRVFRENIALEPLVLTPMQKYFSSSFFQHLDFPAQDLNSEAQRQLYLPVTYPTAWHNGWHNNMSGKNDRIYH